MPDNKEKSGSRQKVNYWKSLLFPEEETIDITTTKGFFQDLMLKMQHVDISGMGAQLAYFFLLSFFPLLIFLVTLLPYLHLNVDYVFDFIQLIVPSEVFLLTQGTLMEILTTYSGGGLLSIGIIGTIWSASRGVNALIKALNETYDAQERNSLMNRAWSLLFTISLIIVILMGLLLPIFGQKFTLTLFTFLGVEQSFSGFWKVVRWGMPPTFIFITLILMYWVIPNTNPRLRFASVLPGALFATIAWIISIYGFSFYVNNFSNLNSTYGSITSVIVLMLWLYFTGMILILGGILNSTMHKRKLMKLKMNSKKKEL